MLLKILAGYQIVHAFQRERGPFKIIERVRNQAYQVGSRVNPRVNPDEPSDTEILLSCPHCLSLWVALAVVFILPKKIVEAMAIWGGASQMFYLWEAFNQWRFAPTASTSASAPTFPEPTLQPIPKGYEPTEAESLVGLRAVVYLPLTATDPTGQVQKIGEEAHDGVIESQTCACQTASGLAEYTIRLSNDSVVTVTRDLFIVNPKS